MLSFGMYFLCSWLFVITTYRYLQKGNLSGLWLEHLQDWYTGLGTQKMNPKNFISQSLLLCLKYISVCLVHFNSSKEKNKNSQKHFKTTPLHIKNNSSATLPKKT